MSHSCEVAQNSPRLKTQHSGAYTTPEGWSSRQTPSAKAIRRLCRGHSRMFETGRAHAKEGGGKRGKIEKVVPISYKIDYHT